MKINETMFREMDNKGFKMEFLNLFIKFKKAQLVNFSNFKKLILSFCT